MTTEYLNDRAGWPRLDNYQDVTELTDAVLYAAACDAFAARDVHRLRVEGWRVTALKPALDPPGPEAERCRTCGSARRADR